MRLSKVAIIPYENPRVKGDCTDSSLIIPLKPQHQNAKTAKGWRKISGRNQTAGTANPCSINFKTGKPAAVFRLEASPDSTPQMVTLTTAQNRRWKHATFRRDRKPAAAAPIGRFPSQPNQNRRKITQHSTKTFPKPKALINSPPDALGNTNPRRSEATK